MTKQFTLDSIHPNEGYPLYVANIVTGVTLTAIFIGCFYFTLGKTVELNVLTKNVDIIVDSFTGDISQVVSSQTLQENSATINNNLTLSASTQASLNTQDLALASINTKIVNQAIIMMCVIFVVGLVIVISCWFWSRRQQKDSKGFNLLKLLLTNLCIVFFVGLTYTLFYLTVASYYQVADPNLIKAQLISAAQQYGSSSSSSS